MKNTCTEMTRIETKIEFFCIYSMKGLLCHTREDPRRFRLHVMTNRKIQQKKQEENKKEKCVNGFFSSIST
jgi:hypothetical protein